MKKKIIAVIAAGSACLLGGCLGRGAWKGTDMPVSVPVALTFMMPQSHDKDFLEELLEAFEEENPDIRIEVQRIPDNQWIDLVKSKAAVGEMPDLIRIDKGIMEEAGTDRFVEFGEDTPWFNRVKQEQLVNKMIDGHLYGLPIGSVSSVGIIYNAEVFEKLGLDIPKNKEALRRVCDEVRKEGMIPLYASDKDSWTVQMLFGCMAVQAADEDTWNQLLTNQAAWTDIQEFEEILTELSALRRWGYTNTDYMEATYDGAVEAMASGTTAMYVSGQFFIKDVIKMNPERQLMMMPVPYEDKDLLTIISGPGMFAVSKDSEHVEEAKRFLEWFSQPEHMDKFNTGWSHMSVFKDQKLILNSWQQELYDRYISKGKTVPIFEERMSGISLNEFWNNQREMIAGRMTAGEVLTRWEEDFGEQMRYRKMTGWD